MKWVLIVLLTISVSACSVAPEPSRQSTLQEVNIPNWKYAKAQKRAIDYLLSTQKKDGSWYHVLPLDGYRGQRVISRPNYAVHCGNASCAIICMALLEMPKDEQIEKAMYRGYEYLVDAPEARRTDGFFLENVWAHLYMVHGLSLGLLDSRLEKLHAKMRERCRFELKALFDTQAISGGWGYYSHNRVVPTEWSCTCSTAAAVVALYAAKEAGFDVPSRRVEMACDRLLAARNPDGSYCYSPRDSRRNPISPPNQMAGASGRTQACNYGLSLWKQPITVADVDHGLSEFFRLNCFMEAGRARYYPHEAFFAVAPYYYYYVHYYAAESISVVEKQQRKQYATKLLEKVVPAQSDDGSYWDTPMFGLTKTYATGFAILIMERCRKILSDKS